MRVRLAAFFIFTCTFTLGVPVHAAVLDSQTNDSAQSTRPNISTVYHAVGYVSSTNFNLAGVRFRVNRSGGGDYVCPAGDIYQYSSTSTPISWNYGPSWATIVGGIVLATSTPDINGNCNYTTINKYGQAVPVPISTGNYYVFIMATGGNTAKWVSMNGKPFASSTPQSFFGYRPASSNYYAWGTSGLDAPYFEFFDTAPPITYPSPAIILTGAATTTAEFGSTFTDLGATAHDDTDGDITSAIQVTGRIDTGVMGTTTLTYAVTNSYGLSATTTRAVVVACTHDCYSNVIFLPGIEGSRLYEGTGCGKATEEKLWEPVADSLVGVLRGAGDAKVHDLALDANGASVCTDIYTKEGDVVDTAGGSNIYKSLIDEMNGLKTDGSIRDWKPVAYDWRLSLDDVLTRGIELNSRIYYATTTATSTPYIEQTLRTLAASSKTGKVSIVAHSNGGLVIKALLNKLGSEASKSLVDKVIMVGVPQSGAPGDIGSMLVGYGAGLYAFKGLVPIVSNAAARTFTQNSPMAYHLLPSASYLASIIDEPMHPVVHFAGSGFAQERAAYGNSIVDLPTLDDFFLAKHGEREKPVAGDLLSSEILNPTLIDYANTTHTTLDAWTPPSGIEVSQIAGWGVDTVGGVDFYTAQAADALTALEPLRTYRPIFIEDGDGTVPVPSALLISTSTENVKRYWVDLRSYNKDSHGRRSHSDLFEIPSLEDLLKNIIKSSTSTLPAYISSNQPPPETGSKKLTFFLHSPLTLELTDSSGNVTGLATDGSVAQNIPGSTYNEFGEVKYVSVPQGSTYELTMHGQSSGTFSLDIQESSGGIVTASSTITNVPTTANTLASLTISNGIDTASPLTVDKNGDGNVITIAPKIGETVSYEPPAPVPESRSGSGGGWSPTPATVPVVATTSSTNMLPTTEEVPIVASSTQIIATSAPVAVLVPTKPLQTKRKVITTPITQPKKVDVPIQTASVYDASQQPVLNKLGEVVYYSLHRLWTGLQRIFHLK